MTPFSSSSTRRLSLAMVVSLQSLATASTTIPCPGVDNPANFSAIPLSARPNLERILQNGYQPNRLEVKPPSLEAPGPQVDTYQAFVDRPFRTLSQDSCRWEGQEIVRCARSGSSSFGPAPSSLALSQFNLAMGAPWEYPSAKNLINEQSFHSWAEHVQEFFEVGVNDDECRQQGTAWLYNQAYSCVVALTDCQTIDPEFKADLAVLPTDSDDLSAYQAFVEKWGQGTVGNFGFGTVEFRAGRIDIPDPRPILYLGRAGGTGNTTIDELYTEEECQDPAPINVNYQPWDEILEDLLFWDNDEIIANTNLDLVSSKFYELRQSYSRPSRQLSDAKLNQWDILCPPPDAPSAAPSESSSETPTVRTSLRPSATVAPTSEPTTESGTSGSSTMYSTVLGTLMTLLCLAHL